MEEAMVKVRLKKKNMRMKRIVKRKRETNGLSVKKMMMMTKLFLHHVSIIVKLICFHLLFLVNFIVL